MNVHAHGALVLFIIYDLWYNKNVYLVNKSGK